MSYGYKDENGNYKKIAGNSGSSGTSDYTELENKPSINDVELSGNKSADDLGLYTKEEIDEKVDNRKRLDLPLENLIPQDADLNNYTDVGEYCNPYSAVSATLLHCPVSASGFRLTVEKLYSDEPTQTLESYSGIIYKRTYNSSGSAWLDWRKITLDGNPIIIPVNPSTTPTTEGAMWIEIV